MPLVLSQQKDKSFSEEKIKKFFLKKTKMRFVFVVDGNVNISLLLLLPRSLASINLSFAITMMMMVMGEHCILNSTTLFFLFFYFPTHDWLSII